MRFRSLSIPNKMHAASIADQRVEVEGFYGYLHRCTCKPLLFTSCLLGFKILTECLQLICFAWLSQIQFQ